MLDKKIHNKYSKKLREAKDLQLQICNTMCT